MVAEVTKKRRRMYSNLISILTGTQEWCEHFFKLSVKIKLPIQFASFERKLQN